MKLKLKLTLQLKFKWIQLHIRIDTMKLLQSAGNFQQNFNLIAGVATAGIPHGTLIAHKLNLPFVYVRSSEKKHGRKNKIEGEVIKKNKVVVVEDLISTGQSSLNAAKSLQIAGCEVAGIISIFNYNFKHTEEVIKKNKFKYISLCNFNDLITQAKKENYITGDEYNFILDWHEKFNI